MKKLISIVILLLFSICVIGDISVNSNEDIVKPVEEIQEVEGKQIDVVYFYGTGCPHCSKLEEYLDEVKSDYNLNITSYEVYASQENRDLATEMAEAYGDSFRGVPMTFIGDKMIIGFSSNLEKEIENALIYCAEEECSSPFFELGNGDSKDKLTLTSVLTLAVADSVNPCALAVLTMVLVALLARDPKNRKNIIYGGLAFTLAVLITYLFYGLIIIQFFKFLSVYFVTASIYVRRVFAALAILLGVLNAKDFFKYKPGQVGTEMPNFMRPMAKRMISSITKPSGAFIIGIFVTLFLLPCTIGPYVVVGNILSAFDFIKVAPWLLFYNIIFVLPMIGITLFVYFGYTTINKVTGWKESNIRYLHLIIGIILILLGIGMWLRII